jgi:hypothetical protein
MVHPDLSGRDHLLLRLFRLVLLIGSLLLEIVVEVHDLIISEASEILFSESINVPEQTCRPFVVVESAYHLSD